MKAWRHPATHYRSRKVCLWDGCWLLVLGALLLFASASARAGPLIGIQSPIAFFTNVAGRLLQSELNISLSRIQIYPTNQYTPAVHRLLQVTANLYDATTNRSITGYPYLPSVFRPMFQSANGGSEMYIVGYREVTNLDLLQASMLDLNDPDQRSQVLPDGNFMFYGVPVVVGAKKGFPNFNEFAMQTRVYVSRLLEFRRAGGDPNGPVVETNQMHVVGISNVAGVEAWNSYSNTYPRDLQILLVADMSATLTNELGLILLTNRVWGFNVTNLGANMWPGWTNIYQPQYGFAVPLTTNFLFLTNSTYRESPPRFDLATHVFEHSQVGFTVPHWWLNLSTRLRYVLVDTGAQRVVDYVNLDHSEETLDITTKLMEGADCSTIDPTTFNNIGSQWCTNRVGGSFSVNAPTYGILNQIWIGLLGAADWARSFSLDPAVGRNADIAVDFFRYNLMGFSPLPTHNYPGGPPTFYKSNVFYAPFDPFRPIHIHTTWQANDPLVHYTMSDLLDITLTQSNRVDFASHSPPLENLGFFNLRYRPWSGSPLGASGPSVVGDYELAAKDPLVRRSDDWDFPVIQSLSSGGLGRVHRGTPWQTLYLKSAGVDALKWQKWVGVADPREAALLQPANDWRVVSLLASLFNDKDPRSLSSANQSNPEGWKGILNGMLALTNVAPAQLNVVLVSSNSPQADTIANSLMAARLSQPGQIFRDFGDILATPELSVASPWLNLNDTNSINDTAYEVLPAQILRRLRPDSFASIAQAGSAAQVQFSGFDGYTYAVQVSSDLANWTSVATNYPTNGFFIYLETVLSSSPRFFRSVLLP